MGEAVILSVCPGGVYLRLVQVFGQLFCLGSGEDLQQIQFISGHLPW